MKRDDVILVRGGGDLATGTIHRLWSAGLKVLVLEAEHRRCAGDGGPKRGAHPAGAACRAR